MKLSRRTVIRELQRELRGQRVFQLFVRKLGPNDVVYASALAWGEDGRVVECKASAENFDDALEQLLLNLDQATAPEGT